jgi:hypothetical protein
VRLGDLLPAIESMGVIGSKFPLGYCSSISIGLRLVDPNICHVLAGHGYGDTTSTAMDKGLAKFTYALTDVQLLRIESMFNGPQAKA